MQATEWFRRFEDGDVIVETDERTGRLSPNRSDEVIPRARDLVRADRRLTTGEVAEELDISSGPCQAISAKYLDKRRVSTKFTLRLLRGELKEHSLSVASDLLECAAED
jgi:hypothetical protein